MRGFIKYALLLYNEGEYIISKAYDTQFATSLKRTKRSNFFF